MIQRGDQVFGAGIGWHAQSDIVCVQAVCTQAFVPVNFLA
jgi:hypothetical protein